MNDLKKIITTHLISHGFDGLCNSMQSCGCQNSDLMPCEGYGMQNCEPAYKGKCDPDHCEADGDCPFHMYPTRQDGKQPVDPWQPCSMCDGSGHIMGSGKCHKCGGVGRTYLDRNQHE